VFIGSGSSAFPAPRSSLPVARLNLRGFPLNHRLLLTSFRSLAGARPSWASLLSRTRGHLCRPRSIGPGRFVYRPPLLRFVALSRDSLSSTSSPASAFPWCFHHFGFEQQAQIAFRPCRFARLRRVSPPIARVFTELVITVHGDEGLAGLLRPAANRRVRCVSSAWSGGASPRNCVIADTVPCWSLGFAVPRIEVRTPRRIPPACSRSTSPWSLPPRTFRRLRSATLPMSPFPVSLLLSYRRDLVPRGFAPLAGPYHRVPFPIFVGLPSLGLVPLRGRLQVESFESTELR
jgi:hypothetical protein